MTLPMLRSAQGFTRSSIIAMALPVVIGLQACAAPATPTSVKHTASHQVDVAALARAGDEAYERGDYREAQRAYGSLAQALPASFDAWLKLGNAHLREGRAQPAEQAYQKAIELMPEDPRAWYNLATARLMKAKGALRGAAETLDQNDPARRLAVQRLRVLDTLIFKALEGPTRQTEATISQRPGPSS